jgi:Uma2 family endonuclease
MTEAAAAAVPVTAAEFYARYAGGDRRCELVDGEVIEMSPVSPAHGDVDSELTSILRPFVRERGLGRHYLNTGFYLRRNPDLVRAPDGAFVSTERLTACPPPAEGYWEAGPDLAIEIVSPNDTADDLNDRIRDYLDAGVRMVWVLYPRRKQVHLYSPAGDVRILFEGGVLDGGEILPGFALPLAEFWARFLG